MKRSSFRKRVRREGLAQVYASTTRNLLRDLENLIAAAAGTQTRSEPTRVVGRLDVDPYEAHVGVTKEGVRVPPRARDLDCIRLGPNEVAIVRIVHARERVMMRAGASAGLLLAIGFLLFLLAL